MQLRYRRVASLCSKAGFYIYPSLAFVKTSVIQDDILRQWCGNEFLMAIWPISVDWLWLVVAGARFGSNFNASTHALVVQIPTKAQHGEICIKRPMLIAA